jgi:hypothetical protein
MVRDVTVTLALVFFCYMVVLYTYRMRGAVGAAVAYAILVHFDPQFLLFLPFVAIFFLVGATRYKLLNVQYTFLFLGMVLVLLLPWTFRNYRVYGEAIPVALEATEYLQPIKKAFEDDAAESGVKAAYRPGFWRNTAEFWRVARFGQSVRGGGGAMRTEPPWSLRHNLISIVNYGLLLPFFVVGVWLSVKKRNRAGLILSAVVVGYYLIRAFYGGGEHQRLLVEPLIILLAFYAIVYLYSCRRPYTRQDS